LNLMNNNKFHPIVAIDMFYQMPAESVGAE
jgi:hypothetical protein